MPDPLAGRILDELKRPQYKPVRAKQLAHAVDAADEEHFPAFREAIKELVPASVLEQPKRGFAVPLNRWFNTELSHRLDTLLRPDRAVYEYVDRDSVTRLVREHRSRRRDHSHYLWRILVLDLWLNALRRGELSLPSEGLELQERDVLAGA